MVAPHQVKHMAWQMLVYFSIGAYRKSLGFTLLVAAVRSVSFTNFTE